MITKFQTSALNDAPKKGGNTLLYIIAGAVIVYVAYRFVIKPEMDKRKEQQQK
jgi:hypothetical protein